MGGRVKYLTLVIGIGAVYGCGVINSSTVRTEHQPEQKKTAGYCIETLNSNCANSEKIYFQSFMKAMDKNGFNPGAPKNGNEPPALAGLPKDHNGLVNWTLSSMGRKISPKDILTGEERERDKPFNMIVMFQAKVGLMADVLFPHSVHTYWLSCKNCHPRIFIPQVGANAVTMKAITEGKFCGKCHGKVAFPMSTEYDCRRCHSQQKRHVGRG